MKKEELKKIISSIVQEEFSRRTKLEQLKEEKARIEKQLEEMDDFEGDIPDSWQDFDEFEAISSAKDAAAADIEADPEMGGFKDIGEPAVEKGMTVQKFMEPIKAANLKLPNQEKDLANIQKGLDFEKKFGKMSVNESEDKK